jgi:uncharacterized protein (DUF2062 family)
MPRRFIKRFLPHPDRIKENKSLRHLGELIHDPNLWHLNRHSVARAMAVGLFWAIIPMPLQMLAAAATAIPARANLPISAALVWLTNPLTTPPIFYFSYVLGAWLMDTPALEMPDEITLRWIAGIVANHWQPLYLGSFVLALICAAVGYVLTRMGWRLWVQLTWRKRLKHRQRRDQQK